MENNGTQNNPSGGKWRTCLKLFTTSLFISAVTFGGGYVIISFMKDKFVDKLGWLEENEMLNLTAIAQSAPGPVAVNTAYLTGYRLAGIRGALSTLLGTILPPLVTITVISFFYEAFKDNRVVSAVLKGMQAGIAAVIADVVVKLGGNVVKTKDIASVLLMLAAFAVAYFTSVNVVFIILVCAAFGAVRTLVFGKKKKEGGK